MNDIATYNGYCNRETWLISLWLNNDQTNYELLGEVLRMSTTGFKKAEKLEALVSNQISDLELGASLWSDLLSTALAKVDWLEVIESNLE